MTDSQVLEVAVLSVLSGRGAEFEAAFRVAAPIITASPGYLSHELRRCIEVKDRYVLLVKWRSLEDHTAGFRGSVAYEEWKKLLHPFYDPFPIVEHYACL